jgi:hypothetical protein
MIDLVESHRIAILGTQLEAAGTEQLKAAEQPEFEAANRLQLWVHDELQAITSEVWEISADLEAFNQLQFEAAAEAELEADLATDLEADGEAETWETNQIDLEDPSQMQHEAAEKTQLVISDLAIVSMDLEAINRMQLKFTNQVGFEAAKRVQREAANKMQHLAEGLVQVAIDLEVANQLQQEADLEAANQGEG